MFGISGSVLAAGIGAAGIVGGAAISANAAKKGSKGQLAATEAQIAQQNKQFEAIQKLLAPYQAAGTGSLTAQQNLIGLNGNDAQSAALQALQGSPQFQALTQQGENAILANASATGGLRGGNTQGALAQFRPALLGQLINDQYARLGGMTSIGQNAAAGVGNAGMATGNNITQLLGQMGQIGAGNALAQGRAGAGLISGLGQVAGGYFGYNGFGGSGYTQPNLFGQYANPTRGGDGEGIDQWGYLGGPSTAGDYSDVRLKKNIRRIGVSDKGNTLYEWEWRDGSGKARGVIAQEIAANDPSAVSPDRFGFLRVNYDRV